MPILVDGDTGGGGVVNVQRLVRELVGMGAAGVFLEDQVWPKRCGHMRGKAIVPLEEHVREDLRRARRAWRRRLPDRRAAPTRAPSNGLDEAIRRGLAMKEAGADLVFIEAPQGVDEMRRITAEIPPPLLVNMVEGGRTPLLPLQAARGDRLRGGGLPGDRNPHGRARPRAGLHPPRRPRRHQRRSRAA